jgi:hypothetical protein
MKRFAYVVALCAAAIAVGCGDDGDDVNNNADNYDGTDAEVASVVDDFANAGRDGDGTKLCEDFLTPELVANIEKEAGQSCPSEFEEELEEGEYELEIDSLEVKGDTATVGVTDQKDRSTVFNVERVDADWRIASFTPAL